MARLTTLMCCILLAAAICHAELQNASELGEARLVLAGAVDYLLRIFDTTRKYKAVSSVLPVSICLEQTIPGSCHVKLPHTLQFSDYIFVYWSQVSLVNCCLSHLLMQQAELQAATLLHLPMQQQIHQVAMHRQ